MRSHVRAVLAAFALVGIAGTAQAQSGFKIAYVNTQVLMAAAPGRAAAESLFAKETAGLEAQLRRMNDSLNKLVSDYQKAEPTLTPAQRETRQKGMQELNTEFQAKQLEIRRQADERQEQLLAPLMEAVRKVLEDIRAEDGYAMILANDPGASPILTADKNLDITDRVVARLRTVSAVKPAAPSTAGPAGVKRPPAR